MSELPHDIDYAAQLDDYLRTPALVERLLSNINHAHDRIDVCTDRLKGFAAAEDRQDEALTEMESRMLDYEHAADRLRQALATIEQQQGQIAQIQRQLSAVRARLRMHGRRFRKLNAVQP